MKNAPVQYISIANEYIKAIADSNEKKLNIGLSNGDCMVFIISKETCIFDTSLSIFDENLMCCKYDVGMKDFDSWNEVKKFQEIKDRSACPIFIKEREIWWLSLGLNIGDEEDGKGKFFERPILVIKKFNNKLFWGCALSTKIKDNNRYYITVSTKNGLRSVIISQLRLHDTKRLRDKLDRLNINDFDKVKTAIKGLL